YRPPHAPAAGQPQARARVRRQRRGRLAQHLDRPGSVPEHCPAGAPFRQPADRLRPQLGGADPHDLLPTPTRTRRGQGRRPPAAPPPWKEDVVRTETFSTPGKVKLEISLPSGDVDLETGAGETTTAEA